MLDALVFCYLHPTRGPCFPVQVPSAVLQADHYASRFIIPKSEYFSRPIITMVSSIREDEYLVVSYPTKIEENFYSRNALMFAPVFVFKRGKDFRPFLPVLEKFSSVLIELEKGIALISKSVENARHSEFTNSDESAQGSFYKLFREIFDSFLMKGKCSVVIDGKDAQNCDVQYTVRLDIQRHHVLLVDARAHHVPIKGCFDALRLCCERDNACRIIAPFIDDCRSICHVATCAHMDLKLALRTIQFMHYVGAVHLVEPLLYTSPYILTEQIVKLFEDRELQRECSKFIRYPKGPLLSTTQIFNLYSQFSPHCKLTPYEFLLRNEPLCRKFCLRRFIQFGHVHNFLRCVHKYPVRSQAAPLPVDRMTRQLARKFDGRRSVAELCAWYGLRTSDVIAWCIADEHTTIINK
eukprot:gene4791-6859_t